MAKLLMEEEEEQQQGSTPALLFEEVKFEPAVMVDGLDQRSVLRLVG